MYVNEPQNGRIATLAFGIRSRELRQPDFLRLFVNTVEWLGGRKDSWRLPLDPASGPSEKLKVYVLRSGHAASDTAVQNALTRRGTPSAWVY